MPTIGAEVPPSLRGVWRREELSTPGGFSDKTTRVVWLQTPRFYADIRIPADRPKPSGAVSFHDFTDGQLKELARVQGFGGRLLASEAVCLWRRDLDYQPPGETPDEARYEIEADRMLEFGIHAEYTEVWRRIPGSGEALAALRCEERSGGLMVIAGDHFLEIRGRDRPLPAGARLADIVARDLGQGRRDLAAERLSMRICYGLIAGGRRPWEIMLSTLPWLETTSLFRGEQIRFDDAVGTLSRGDGLAWHVEDATLPLATLAAMLATAEG